MTPAVMDALQVTILVLVAAGATVVVRVTDRVRQVLALSLYGVLLSVLFLAVQAPDVTLSEMVVGAVVLPLILLLAISKVRGTPPDRRTPRGRGELR
jgi:energy-converting hydrogenase B subunit D